MNRKLDRIILKHLLKIKVSDAEPLEQDEEVWRTVSEGNNKGKHFLIETETGEIKGGLGGKMNGVKATPKSERTALTVSEKAMLGAAKQSKDPVEFWMNLSPEQQSKVGKNYKTVFEKLKPHAGNEPEWKPTNGTTADMPRKVDKVPEPPKFEFVNRPNESFVARETPDGVMINTGHPDYNDGVSDFVIAHELGHRVSSQNPELAEAIMANYGDLFGRYNQEKGHFDGVFAEYSPEEAFASTFGHFYTNPDMVKEHYPELYNYMQEFSEANPEMSDYVKAGIKASQQSNTPLSEKLQRIEFNPDWAFNYFDDESQKKELLKNPLHYVGLGKDAELAEILDEGTRQKAYKSDVEIDIDDLETLQPFVLKSGIDNENTLTSNMRPYVCEYKGHYILMDGNHRVSIAKLKGQKKIRVDLSVREDKNPASDTADSVQSPYNRFRPKKLLTRKTKASAIDGDWDESRHPRGKGGRFAKKGEEPTNNSTENLTHRENGGIIDIEIDKLTPCLIDTRTGKTVKTEIKPFHPKAQDCKGWEFDWTKPEKDGFSVYALLVEGDDAIQGMVALKPERGYVELNLVEASPRNNRHNKAFKEPQAYEGVGGHLFAEACRQSFELGNGGFIAFTAKTKLMDYYAEKFGAEAITHDGRMCIDTVAALKLVKKYYEENEDE